MKPDVLDDIDAALASYGGSLGCPWPGQIPGTDEMLEALFPANYTPEQVRVIEGCAYGEVWAYLHSAQQRIAGSPKMFTADECGTPECFGSGETGCLDAEKVEPLWGREPSAYYPGVVHGSTFACHARDVLIRKYAYDLYALDHLTGRDRADVELLREMDAYLESISQP